MIYHKSGFEGDYLLTSNVFSCSCNSEVADELGLAER